MSTNEESGSLEIDCQSVKAKLDRKEPMLLLDCRERDEFALVNIDGAELWPMSELPDRIADLRAHRDREIVVYCHHGMRSMQVTAWLRHNGFARVVSMAGGIDAWSTQVDRALPRY